MQQVILAAGKGNRLKSSITNKCLLNIGGKTLLEHNLEYGKSVNSTDAIVVVGHNRNNIINYLSKKQTLNSIRFVIQEPQLGIANGVYKAKDYILDEFFMCLSDEIVYNECFSEFFKFFCEKDIDCLCGIVKDNIENIKKAYSLDMNPIGKIKKVNEKPTVIINEFKGTGYCLMKHCMLDILESLNKNPIRNEYEMGDWINEAIKQGYNCYAHIIGEKDFNINELQDFKNAKRIIELGV